MSTETKSIEIALFDTGYGGFAVWENKDPPDGWFRISTPLTVEFTPLSRAEVVAGKLSALKVRENVLRDTFARDLNRIETERANLLALTHE